MGSFSLMHWMIVLIIVVLLFGGSKLSDIGKGLGEGIKNFKKGVADEPGSDDKRLEEKRTAEDERKS